MNLSPASLRKALPVGPVSSALAAPVIRTVGKHVDDWAPLLRHVPDPGVVTDILELERALAPELHGFSSSSIAETWQRIERLERHLTKVPSDDAWRAALTLKDRRLQLRFIEDELDKIFAPKAVAAIKKRRARKSRSKAAEQTMTEALITARAAAQVVPRIRRMLTLADTDPELIKLFFYFFQKVPENSVYMRNAAKYAAENAEAVWAILKNEHLDAAQRAQALGGHVVMVRGHLGEGFALADDKVRADHTSRLMLAQEQAVELGPGHQAMFLTQAENGLRFADGQQAMDAGVFIINRIHPASIIQTSTEVKHAFTSQAVNQTIYNRVVREPGVNTKAAGADRAVLKFKPTGSSDEVTLPLITHPKVQRRSIIVNASDARTPGPDLDLLAKLRWEFDERYVEMTVDQMTHIAVSVQEAALEAALDMGLIKR